MTELANLSLTRPGAHRDALTMTCDIPLVRPRTPRTAAPVGQACRPTGRRPAGAAEGRVRTARAAAEAASARRTVRTSAARQAPGVRKGSWGAGLLCGLLLAGLIAVVGVIGSDQERAAAGAPAQTQVVHVRSGESLTSLAARIAPDHAPAAVIATVRELNGLQSTGLRPGQALLVPAYR